MNDRGVNRLSATWRGLGYLLGSLWTAALALPALPVLIVPMTARTWGAARESQRGAMVLPADLALRRGR